ncbi:hypothetical protein ACJX0J_019183, partial [Zea mays]
SHGLMHHAYFGSLWAMFILGMLCHTYINKIMIVRPILIDIRVMLNPDNYD